MTITEKQIEDLIYDSPWLIDERFIIPDIIGSRGEKGRQINLGKSSNRFIDLLFKDTRDNRPVIIELKKGWIVRDNIGQILEYRALIISLDDKEREKWLAEFGQNYYSPKMILIGYGADNDTILSANLSGIEIRSFNKEYPDEIGFETFKELKSKLKEWNSFRRTGNRTLIERQEWINGILEKLARFILNFDNISTIPKVPQFSEGKYYANKISPFIDFPVFYNEEFLFGFYEYFDNELPFDDTYIYCDYSYMFNEDKKEQLDKEIILDFKKFLKANNIDFIAWGENQIPVLKIPRPTLELDKDFEKLLKLLIKKGIEIHDKYNNAA